MKFTRALSLLLAALMLTGTLASCATENHDEGDTAPEGATTVSEEDTVPKDNLPDGLNYGGETVTFYTNTPITYANLSGDPVSDAVFERNKYVESRLNLKIESIEDKSNDPYLVVNKTVNAVKSGSTDYDVIVSPCWVVLDQSISGTFANLAGADYIQLDQPWWTQGFNEAVSFQGNQYAVVGSVLLSIYRSTFATVFNKNLFNDANQPFPYEYVEQGTWTLDKQASLIPLFHRDNGNNTQDATGDYYGLTTGLISYVDPYWASCEVDIMGRNSEGEYELVFNSGRLYDAAEKVLHLYYGTDGGTYIIDAVTDSPSNLFSNGYSAMATVLISALETAEMRNMEDAYGVVPIARLTEEQDGYYSPLGDGAFVIAAPTTTTGEKLDRLGAVLEAMGSASYRIIKPAYYETTLRTKLVSDPQSSEMLDLIIENIRIDAGYIYVTAFESFHHGFRDIIASGVNSTTSLYSSKLKLTEKKVKSLNVKLARLAEKNG